MNNEHFAPQTLEWKWYLRFRNVPHIVESWKNFLEEKG